MVHEWPRNIRVRGLNYIKEFIKMSENLQSLYD